MVRMMVHLELVGGVVEEGVEGVPLAAHPHVVVEGGQLLRDHSVGQHLRQTDVTIAEYYYVLKTFSSTFCGVPNLWYSSGSLTKKLPDPFGTFM